MSSARCNRCGSYKVRRSHSRTGPQKLLRATGLLDRYACGSCGHRGWTWGDLPPRSEAPAAVLAGVPAPATLAAAAPAPAVPPAAGPAAPGSPTPTTAGRKLEKRDHRLKRRMRIRTFLAVGASLALGIVAALYLQRCGVSAPPLPE